MKIKFWNPEHSSFPVHFWTSVKFSCICNRTPQVLTSLLFSCFAPPQDPNQGLISPVERLRVAWLFERRSPAIKQASPLLIIPRKALVRVTNTREGVVYVNPQRYTPSRHQCRHLAHAPYTRSICIPIEHVAYGSVCASCADAWGQFYNKRVRTHIRRLIYKRRGRTYSIRLVYKQRGSTNSIRLVYK